MGSEVERPAGLDLVASKTANSAHGLETSSFTVCARVRPVLPDEAAVGRDCFACIVPGPRSGGGGASGEPYCEELVVLAPGISRAGTPKY